MKAKPYTNFIVTDDGLQLKTKQEPVKTNAAALEAIRQQQCAPVKETFPAHVHYSLIDINISFNEWYTYINKLLTTK